SRSRAGGAGVARARRTLTGRRAGRADLAAQLVGLVDVQARAPRALRIDHARLAGHARAEVAGTVAVIVDVREAAPLVPPSRVEVVVDVAEPGAAVLADVRRPVQASVPVGVPGARVLVEVEGVEARVEGAVELHEDNAVVGRADRR